MDSLRLHAEGPEFTEGPRGLEAHHTLGTKELPFSMWEDFCFDSVVQDTQETMRKGARRLLVCGVGTFVSNNKSPGRLVIWLFRKRALAIRWIMKN